VVISCRPFSYAKKIVRRFSGYAGEDETDPLRKVGAVIFYSFYDFLGLNEKSENIMPRFRSFEAQSNQNLQKTRVQKADIRFSVK